MTASAPLGLCEDLYFCRSSEKVNKYLLMVSLNITMAVRKMCISTIFNDNQRKKRHSQSFGFFVYLFVCFVFNGSWKKRKNKRGRRQEEEGRGNK